MQRSLIHIDSSIKTNEDKYEDQQVEAAES